MTHPHLDEYRLDIYTWPAARGVPVNMRTSYHQTPAEARQHLDAQTEPYAYATLAIIEQSGMVACDWEGRKIDRTEDWPSINGTNGEHPAYLALRRDWPHLVSEIRRIYAETHRPMIDIAGELLRARHPETHSWSEHLAWEAAGK